MTNLMKCIYCGGAIETEDAYCRYCGKKQGGSIPFRYSHAGIIVFTLLFGPVALPFILKSPAITKNGKVAYVLLNLLITACMIGFIFGIYGSINRQVQETMKILDSLNQ